MKKISQKKRRGFTLVELMTATAIMIILIMFVTNIAVDMLKAYDRTIAALSTNSDSRSVLDPLQEDLSSAKMFNDGNTWFEIRYDEAVGNIPRTGAPKIMCFSQARDRIRRSITSTKTRLPGDLCAIVYQIAQQSPFGETASKSPENLVYGVYRSVLNANDTYQYALPYIIGADGKGGSDTTRTPGTFWKSAESITDPSDLKKYSPSTWSKQIQNFLVDGVINFTVIFWYDDFTDGKRKLLTVNDPNTVSYVRSIFNGYEVTTFENSMLASAGSIILDNNFNGKKSGALRSAEISITVIGPDAKNILAGLQRQASTGKIPNETFSNFLLEHGVTFTRSIKLFGE